MKKIIIGWLSIVFIVCLIFVVSAYKNNTSSNNNKGESELKSKLSVSNAELSSCTVLSSSILSKFEDCSDKLSDCKGELKVCGLNLDIVNKQYEETLARLKNDQEEKNKEIDELKDTKEEEINKLKIDYQVLAQNSANNICCKSKVDNPKITSYNIDNNRITCVEGSTPSLSC